LRTRKKRHFTRTILPKKHHLCERTSASSTLAGFLSSAIHSALCGCTTEGFARAGSRRCVEATSRQQCTQPWRKPMTANVGKPVPAPVSIQRRQGMSVEQEEDAHLL